MSVVSYYAVSLFSRKDDDIFHDLKIRLILYPSRADG